MNLPVVAAGLSTGNTIAHLGGLSFCYTKKTTTFSRGPDFLIQRH